MGGSLTAVPGGDQDAEGAVGAGEGGVEGEVHLRPPPVLCQLEGGGGGGEPGGQGSAPHPANLALHLLPQGHVRGHGEEVVAGRGGEHPLHHHTSLHTPHHSGGRGVVVECLQTSAHCVSH